jgi:hypothetical protein
MSENNQGFPAGIYCRKGVFIYYTVIVGGRALRPSFFVYLKSILDIFKYDSAPKIYVSVYDAAVFTFEKT